MNRLPSIRSGLIFLIFNALNILLVANCPEAVSKRDMAVAVVGFLVLFVIVARKANQKQDNVKLQRTARFKRIFQTLSLSEVIATILLPWWVLVRERLGGGQDKRVYAMLSPHLFVFQAQITLDAVVMMLPKGRGDGLMFYYTAAANCYRGIAIFEWIASRFWLHQNDQPAADILLTILPSLTGALWICSNLFIALVWFPLLTTKKPSP